MRVAFAAAQILLRLIIVAHFKCKRNQKITHFAVLRSNLLFAGAYSNFPLRGCSSFGIVVFLLFFSLFYFCYDTNRLASALPLHVAFIRIQRKSEEKKRRRFCCCGCSISSKGKLRNMFARGDISTTTTESINIFLLHINTLCESCAAVVCSVECFCSLLPMVLHIIFCTKEDHFHSLRRRRCRLSPFRTARCALNGFYFLYSIYTLDAHRTNFMHAYDVREYTMLFASISSRFSVTMDPRDVCALPCETQWI